MKRVGNREGPFVRSLHLQGESVPRFIFEQPVRTFTHRRLQPPDDSPGAMAVRECQCDSHRTVARRFVLIFVSLHARRQRPPKQLLFCLGVAGNEEINAGTVTTLERDGGPERERACRLWR